MTTSNAVYSTTTGVESTFGELSEELLSELGLNTPKDDYEFCFVCSRATDHRGEHDDLVEAGKARYDEIDAMVYYAPLGFLTV